MRGEFEGEGCGLEIIRGETDPYQGWVSLRYLHTTPASVVTASSPAGLVESAWRLRFDR